MEGSDSVMGQTEYFQTVGNAGLSDAVDPGRKQGTDQGAPSPKNGSLRGSVKEGEIASIGSGEPPVTYDTKWENSNGKSLLFSKTALDIIEELDHSSVKVQVSICVEPEEPEEEAKEEDWEDEMENEYEGEQENPATSTERKTEEAEEKKNEKKGMCEPLGYASIRLPDHFGLSVLQSCKPEVILPVSCVHRDTCELRNVFGVKKGEIKVFIRLSCFGSVISTSFQSIGPERRYVFKPSPQPDLGGPQEPDIERDSVLKPIIAEEDVAKGIVTPKGIDIFQKSVLWKASCGFESQHCGCMDMPTKVSQFRESSLRHPRASNNSLCLDVDPQKKGKTCEWHNLVTKEIKNSPGGNCGCMDGATIRRSSKASFQSLSKDMSIKTQSSTKISRLDTESSIPSRLAKIQPKKKTPEPNETKAEPNEKKTGTNETKTKAEIEIKPQIKRQTKSETQTKPVIGMSGKVQERAVKPINGFGFRPEPKDCKCNCIAIRNSLDWKPMMKYSWQGK